MRTTCLILASSFGLVCSGQAGSLDTTFAGVGFTLYSPALGNNYNYDCATLADNTILACGYSVIDGTARAVVSHLLNDGSLDPDFGVEGYAVIPGDVPTIGQAIAVDPSDRIIIAGNSAEFAVQRAFVACFTMHGTMDTTFGEGGMTMHDISGESALIRGLSIRTDGQIITCGSTTHHITGDMNGLLISYTESGALDIGFAGDGILVYASSGNDATLFAVVALPGGDVLATGYASIGGDRRTLLVNVHADGSLNSDFGSGGTVTETFGEPENASRDLALVDSGFVVTGLITLSFDSTIAFVAKFHLDGSLDTTFGTLGKADLVDTSYTAYGDGICVQADGRLVVTGTIGDNDDPDELDVLMFRLLANGTADNGFGVDGVVRTDLGQTTELGESVAVQPDGRIVVCGLSWGSTGHMLVARYLADACTLFPTITPETPILCPNGSDELTTGAFDTYQWYKNGAPISGANSQTLPLTSADDAGSWFKVAVGLDSCSAISDSVLVDGYVFLLPYIINEGDAPNLIGDNSEQIYCQGDDPLLVLGAPYDTNVQWFNSGTPIPGANSPSYAVTGSGSYSVEGAPAVCPDFIQNAGVSVVMDFHPYIQPTIVQSGILLCPEPEGISSQWYYNGSPVAGLDQCVIPIDAGNYTVFVDYGDSCSVLSAPFTVVGLAEHTRSELKASPVPTNDRVTITWTQCGPLPDWRVIDVTGRIVRSGMTAPSPLTIDLGTLDVGRYRFLSGDGRSLPLAVTR